MRSIEKWFLFRQRFDHNRPSVHSFVLRLSKFLFILTLTAMSSFATTSNDPQTRTQRRLLFEGFNNPDTENFTRRHHSSTMVTSTPDHRLHEKENENLA